jgi:hypothetical protein
MNNMPTYKTKDGLDYLLPGIGHTVDGLITTDQIIENPRFEEVQERAGSAEVQPAAEPVAAQPAPEAQPQPVAVAPTNQEGDK